MWIWRKELQNAIIANNIDNFDHILSRSVVKSEIKEINEWQSRFDPFHSAAQLGRDQMLTKLLESGAKVNAYSYWNDRDWKSTALHWAALNNKIFCVKLLIKNGADDNMQGNGKI